MYHTNRLLLVSSIFIYNNEHLVSIHYLLLTNFCPSCPILLHCIPDHKSTLTHVLPFVSKRFNSICSKSNYLWKCALVRLAKNQSETWKKGMQDFLKKYPLIGEPEQTDDETMFERHYCTKDDFVLKLVNQAGRAFQQFLKSRGGHFTNEDTENIPVYKELYLYILTNYLMYTSPLFYMPGRILLNATHRFHFFEPRYKALIAEVMKPYPERLKTGAKISSWTSNGGDRESYDDKFSYPSFIYANNSLVKGKLVYIVHIHRCKIHSNGTADVELYFHSVARIQQAWVRPGGLNLYEARVMKLSDKETYSET